MSIPEFLAQLQAEDQAKRDEAAKELAIVAREGLGAPLLVEALSAKHGRTRREAAAALGLMRQSDDSIIAALCALLHERSDKLKQAAARALARLGRPALPQLLAALEEASPYATSYIAWTLGQIKDKAAQEALTTVFWGSSGRAAKMAAQALARIDFQGALHSFSEAARGWGMTPETRKGSMGLFQLGVAAPDPIDIIDATVMGGDSLTAFEISQGKGNRQVLLGAIRGLGERRDTKGIPVLLDALEYDATDVRAEAALALRRLQGPTVRESLLRMLSDTHLPVAARASTAQLLGQLRERRALPLFLANSELPNTHELRIAIARAYPLFRDPHLLSDLLQAYGVYAQEELEYARDGSVPYEHTCIGNALLRATRQLAEKKHSEEQRFAHLRVALSHPPETSIKRAVDVLLDTWPEAQNKELAVVYAGQHLGE